MKIRQIFCTALVVGAMVLLTACRDHFKVYKVNAVEQDQAVALRGQFDEGSFKQAKLTRLTHFANPVKKDDSRIFHPDYHLTWYELRQQEPEPHRTVAFHNQYGDQKWVIGDAKYLAVPAQKFSENHQAPKGLDHYKCYECLDPIGWPPKANPTLEDQWVTQKVELREPLYFCVPVDKKHGREVSEIQLSGWHLAVYGITPKAYPTTIGVGDQFGQPRLEVQESAWLCVPSTKQSWE